MLICPKCGKPIFQETCDSHTAEGVPCVRFYHVCPEHGEVVGLDPALMFRRYHALLAACKEAVNVYSVLDHIDDEQGRTLGLAWLRTRQLLEKAIKEAEGE